MARANESQTDLGFDRAVLKDIPPEMIVELTGFAGQSVLDIQISLILWSGSKLDLLREKGFIDVKMRRRNTLKVIVVKQQLLTLIDYAVEVVAAVAARHLDEVRAY